MYGSLQAESAQAQLQWKPQQQQQQQQVLLPGLSGRQFV